MSVRSCGEGLSGMLPAMIALGQGAGDIRCVNKSSQTNATFPNGTEYNKTVYNIYPEYVEPYFSVRVYFIILAGIIACSATAFLLLNCWGYCKSEMVEQRTDERGNIVSSGEQGISTSSYGSVDSEDGLRQINNEARGREIHYDTNLLAKQRRRDRDLLQDGGHIGPYYDTYDTDGQRCIDSYNDDENDHISVSEMPYNDDNDHFMQTRSDNNKCSGEYVRVLTSSSNDSSFRESLQSFMGVDSLPLWEFFLLLSILVIINTTVTTFLSTIQVYSVLPYGLGYYHLTTTLTQITNPVACFLALFVMAERVVVMVMVTVVGEMCVVYIVYLAARSPDPPLHDESGGGELVVLVWILLTFLLVYAKVCVAGTLRSHGRHALIWAGVATQVGSLIGAVVGFLLVNEYGVFQDAPYC